MTLDKEWHQPVAVVNYPQTARLHPDHRVQAPDRAAAPEDQRSPTSIRRPRATPTTRSREPENQALFKKYERSALATPDVWFVGRLATYRYYNMDQIVGQALATFRRINEALPADAETSPARVMKSAAALAS